MDKQGNTYTFMYAAVLVIVVATLLAMVSQLLKDRQARNELVAKKTDILQSVSIESNARNAEEKFKNAIKASYVVNFNGDKVEGVDALSVDMAKEVRKKIEERNFPVYEATLENGQKKYILQLRGTGLWGPIWGYVSINDDGNTIYGATFGHKSETPGLGAEIDKPFFQDQFKDKQIFDASGNLVSVMVNKGKAPQGALHEVDAISGGTITSKGLEDMLKSFFQGYEKFLKKLNSESHE